MTHKSRIIVIVMIILGIAAAATPKLYRAISEAYQEYQRNNAPEALAMSGEGMTNAEATVQEARLRVNPNDIGTRTKLLGYYHARMRGAGKWPNPASGAYAANILWLIRNRPEAPVLGTPFAEFLKYDDQQGYAACKA